MKTIQLSFLPFLGLLLLSFIAHAQDAFFKVVANKGNNTINESPIKIGQEIYSLDRITVVDKGYLGLVYTNGRTIELREAGEFKAKELEKQVKGKTNSLAAKMLELLFQNSEETENELSTGGLVRALEGDVHFALPKTSKIMGNSVNIQWSLNKEVKTDLGIEKFNSYTLYILDIFGSELFKVETKSENYSLSFSDSRLKGSNIIVYRVEASHEGKHYKSLDQSLQRLAKETIEKIQQDLELFGSSETAISKVVKAQYFEEIQLYPDALNAYQDAVKLEPEVQMYQKLYESFLRRIPQEVHNKK